MKSYIQKILLCIGLAVGCFTTAMPIYAYEDGAYLVSLTTTYEDPRTGQPADGGTQVALGNSMAQSIVETQGLVEYDQGVSYMTIGIGLASNISNVRILVNDQQVSASISGTSASNGDTVNHYRFKAQPGSLVSFILYVAPMGRDVQFFVQTGTSLTKGTGIYYSAVQERINQKVASELAKQQEEAIKAEEAKKAEESTQQEVKEDTTKATADSSTKETTTNENKETSEESSTEKKEDTTDTDKNNETTTVSAQDLLESVTGLSKHIVSTTKSDTSMKVMILVPIGIGVIVIVGVCGYFGYKKFKGRSMRNE